MAQSSGPISQGTTTERQFTDVQWRDLFGDEPGVVGDMDGSAYALTLPTSSDTVSIGSATQRSTAQVAGFGHAIPANTTEGITIPTASGTARTDIIALRYDPAFTGLPGPVRLTRIAGTSAALPAYDSAPPGVEDLPLWAITRQPGQALSQATTQRLFSRIARVLEVPVGAALPLSSPLSTVVTQGSAQYRRELNSSNTPTWVRIGTTILNGRSGNPNNAISGGSANETGFTPIPAMSKFTLASPSRVKLECQFRVNGPGVALCSIKVDGTTQGFQAVHRENDESVMVVATFDLAAGEHTPSARVDAFTGASVTWASYYLTGMVGVAE